MLTGEGADPNSQGRYKRTPLWRAAYAGHARVVQMLLRAGSDPRTPDEQGQKPWEQANGADVKLLLESWDTSVADYVYSCSKMPFQASNLVRRLELF